LIVHLPLSAHIAREIKSIDISRCEDMSNLGLPVPPKPALLKDLIDAAMNCKAPDNRALDGVPIAAIQRRRGSFERLLERLERLERGETLSTADKIVVQAGGSLMEALADFYQALAAKSPLHLRPGQSQGFEPFCAFCPGQTFMARVAVNLRGKMPMLFGDLATSLGVQPVPIQRVLS
jgi:hypothetical protein